MKTTIDLPEHLLHRAKVVAAQRKTTLRDLITTGLMLALRSGDDSPKPPAAMNHLRTGFHLGGEPLNREQTHGRR